jgi:hypothetical protein
MTMLQAAQIGIADPFVYAPFEVSDVDDIDSPNCNTGRVTAIISGFMHASPPTMQGISSILSLEPEKNVKGTKIEFTAE